MRSLFIGLAGSVALPLLLALSLHATEPSAMPDYSTPPAAATAGNVLQPACGAECASGCRQNDCCCGGVRCGCDCGCGIVAGAEVVFLRPYFNNNVAMVGFSGQAASVFNTEFSSNYDASPRIWLGYVGPCGFGARLTYWQYDQAANGPLGVQTGLTDIYFAPGVTSAVPFINMGSMETNDPNDTLATSEHIHMYTLDAEVTQCMQICCWNMTFGGGLRDASLHIGRENIYTPANLANFAPEDATIDNNFDGIGPTAFAEFRRPIGCSGFSFVGGLRGSLLYGTKSLHVYDVSPNWAQPHTYDQSVDGCVGVAELSLGVEWDWTLSCNRSLFVQGLWENQYWCNVGNSISPAGDSLGLGGFGFAVGFGH